MSSIPTAQLLADAKSRCAYTDNGLWTPQTFMLQAIQQWFSSKDLPDAKTALSIDLNPTLDGILLGCWPDLQIQRAVHPQHDVQRLDAFADNQFDVVYSHQVLEHIPKPWLAGHELVRVLKPGGFGIHTTCAFNPLHGPPDFKDFYRFLPDGLAELFSGVNVFVKAGWGNREALAHNLTVDDGHGMMGGRRFNSTVGEKNEEIYPWVTWIIFQKETAASKFSTSVQIDLRPSAANYEFDSEKKEQLLVRSLVKPGMTLLDVGANIGKYTKLFSLLTGDTGKVFAFEPDPDSAKKIKELLAKDNLNNVSLANKAVSEKCGTVTLNQFPAEYCSWNSLGRPQMEDPKKAGQLVPIVGSIDVETVTLDEFCHAHGIEHIDYLKLDVEGAEFQALQGANNLLKNRAIRFLQFEISRKMLEGLDTCAKPVFDLLADHGYECHGISNEGRIADMVCDSSEFYENYIALPVPKKEADKPVRPRNIIISGTNFWNPGDDFVRDGIIRVLQEVFAGETLNFLFYNFNADFFPQEKFAGIGNYVAKGDLEKCRDFVDAVVIAGLSAGDEIKDLYDWIIANGLEDKVCLIGAGYENDYVAHHISQEPEATIFRKARLVTGRTAKTPEFFQRAGIPYHHINCPAILSVPEVKKIPAGKKFERIGFSIQLPHGEGLANHSCARQQYELAVSVLRDLSRDYEVEVVAHHKTEYFHFLNLLRDENIPVIFSSFYQDLHQIYPRYDLVVTTRLHSSLFANGHGIPGIIINDTDRHTHTLEGFPHSTWINNQAAFNQALTRWLHSDLAAIVRESAEFKIALLKQYVRVLSARFRESKPSNEAGSLPNMAAKNEAWLNDLAAKLMPALQDAENKRRVYRIISGLEKDCWLERNLTRYQDIDHSWFDTATLLNWCAHVLKPECYLEIGVRCGRSMSQVLVESPQTQAYGFDLWIPDYGSEPDKGIITTNPGPEFVLAGLKKLGVRQLPILTQGDSHITVPAFFHNPANPQSFDLILVDGDHTDEGARADLELAFAHLVPGGVLILDDITHPSHPGLKAVWDECAKRFPDHLFINDGFGTGTGVVFRPPFTKLASALQIPIVFDDTALPDQGRPIPTVDLSVHFFTIVLNGRPFIQHHIEQLRQLPFRWHWHIIEGVAELNHDTGWSKSAGGKIPDELRHAGLSVDGTTKYLDVLKKEFSDRITIYRPPAGKFWDGKLEMVNASLKQIQEECLLWQIDADELWTAEQIKRARSLFLAHPQKTAALFRCHYFVGPELVVTSHDTYGNRSDEWLRVWRYQPGDKWTSHEPPKLARRNAAGEEQDVASSPFTQDETEAEGLVFDHYAYASEVQVRFKENYYGYKNAVTQWRRLQAAGNFPVPLSDYFAWVDDDAVVNTVQSCGIRPLAPAQWFANGFASSALHKQFNPVLLARRLEYGNGVHPQEGPMRWLTSCGEIHLPNQFLSGSVNLTFSLSAGDLWCYGKQLFQTVISLDGKPLRPLFFNRNGQKFEITMRLEPRPASQLLTIESTASFVPAQIDRNSRDQRQLAVKFSDLTIVEISETAQIESQTQLAAV
jgi:FkbM family methyltransferase